MCQPVFPFRNDGNRRSKSFLKWQRKFKLGELQVGEWLNQGEGLVHSEDVPSHLNEEAAAVLNDSFFARLDDVKQVTQPSDE